MRPAAGKAALISESSRIVISIKRCGLDKPPHKQNHAAVRPADANAATGRSSTDALAERLAGWKVASGYGGRHVPERYPVIAPVRFDFFRHGEARSQARRAAALICRKVRSGEAPDGGRAWPRVPLRFLSTSFADLIQESLTTFASFNKKRYIPAAQLSTLFSLSIRCDRVDLILTNSRVEH